MKIHFIGIGGIGVSALARYYLAQGYQISGSDLVSSEITDVLKKLGAKIYIPHQSKLGAGQVGKHKLPDLIIYSPAIPENNPELKDAKNLGIKCLSYPQALGELTKKYFTIAVCGSHGKSTVTAMIGLLLTKADFDPTVIVGTKLKEFGNSNCRVAAQRASLAPSGRGKPQYLIIEADEHFASFLNYWPKIIVLTTLEKDHLDYFKSFKNYISAFKKFVSHLPKGGVLVANKDDKRILRMLKSKIQFKIQNYSLKQREATRLKTILKIPGEFNISNALAALTVARVLKIPDKISFKALSEYKGSWRRFEEQELKIENCKLKIINDYGHHPTQVKVTLKAAREKYPKKEIWCIYQPHQYQRTYYLFKDFVKVFRQAPVDKLIITDIYDVAGREEKEVKKKVNSQKLVKAINKKNVIYLRKEEILDYLKNNLQGGLSAEAKASAGEVVIIMGAGDIYTLPNSFHFEDN